MMQAALVLPETILGARRVSPSDLVNGKAARSPEMARRIE
jgi:hypothetical protein